MNRRIVVSGIIVLIVLGGGAFLLMHHHAKQPAAHKSANADTIKPTVELTTPAADLTNVQGTLHVAVRAADNRDVNHVTYMIDGKFAGISYAAPYSISLDISTFSVGQHTLTITAYDSSNNASQTQSVNFTIAAPASVSGSNDTSSNTGASSTSTGTRVIKLTGTPKSTSGSDNTGNNNGSGTGGGIPLSSDTTPPSVPANLTATDPGTFFVHLTWSAATDNVGVTGYQVWRDNTMVGTVTGTSYDDHTSLPGGTYQYKVVAFDAAGNTASANAISINLAAATVFNNSDVAPGDSGDASSIELGMRFRAAKDGEITGVRFYKSAANTGTHVGNLWTNTGTNLASITFANESSSGWQDATFSSPVHITAGTTYVVSYFAPNGHYDGSTGYWQVPHATNDYLTGLQDGTDGSNGIFNASGSTGFPASTFHSANYWVDADFTPETAGTFITAHTCPGVPSYPDASCTGALGGDTMSTLTGGVILDNNNQTYSNLKVVSGMINGQFVAGNIVVSGCGDTLHNIEIDTGEPYTGDLTTPDLFAIWLQVPPNCTTTIDHVSIITQAAPSNYVTTGIRVANGGEINVTNTRISGVQIGILTGPGTLQDNYILLGATQRGDHNENILDDGTSNLTINHNTFLDPNLQTSALSLFTENGPNNNLLIENNLLAGGGYTVYAADGTQDGVGNPIGPPTNISFINNVFWRKYYPDSGSFASGRAYNPNAGGQWTGNTYMSSDGSIVNDIVTNGTMTNETVPQPPLAS